MQFKLLNVYAQGPIYNFNFFNNEKTSTEDSKMQKKALQEVVTTNLESVKDLRGSDNDSFLFFDFGLGGSNGPFAQGHGKEEYDEALAKDYYYSPAPNKERYLKAKKFTLGFGFKLNDYSNLIVSGHYKKLTYHYLDEYGGSQITEYNGKGYGFSIGPQFKIPLGSRFSFVTQLLFSYTQANLDYPYFEDHNDTGYYWNYTYRSISMGKGEYRDYGGELGLGFDYKLSNRVALGFMGKLGMSKIEFEKASNESGNKDIIEATEAIEIIKRSKNKIDLGFGIKFFI